MLETPLTYQGGKQRVAKQIVDIIASRNDVDGKDFYDLCCGSGAITIECVNRDLPFSKYYMLDLSVWGDFWKSIGDGSFLISIFKLYIDDVPKDKHEIEGYIKRMASESPYDGVDISHIYKFLLIQANAFGGTSVWIDGGRWKKAGGYRSYWMPTSTSNRRSPVNPMMPMPDTLYARVSDIWGELYDNIVGINDNVENYTSFPDEAIIYIDPPYKETTGYGNGFDVVSWATKVKSNCNATIYISKQRPLGEISFLISEKRKKGNISGNSNGGVEEWLTEF
jgi:16S rRNA G966 N2-methylase RsmD